MEDAELVIIGAGMYGLTSASTYHRLHPEAKILILDSSPAIGGPWAPHRIFPGLKTNNQWGMYAHPDFPMDEEKFGVKKGEHIPAEKVLEYLNAFAEWSGITKFLRLKTVVGVIEKDGEDWNLHCTSSSSTPSNPFNVRTKKLIIAVGSTNKPHIPKYSTSTSFDPLVIHSKDFPRHFKEIVQPNMHTLVIGSGKSAWDVAYACATQPSSSATILIRPSGNGPMWMTPSHVTPLTLWLEKLVFTRFFGFMSPCPWASTSGIEGWLRSFLQGTWLGRKITGAFWNILGEDAIALNKLNEHPETKKLRPWRGAFEVGNGLSIHNYSTNFFDLVREGRINIVIDEIESLEEGREVRMKSGEKIKVDAVVCATGWEVGNTFKFKPDGLERELGMPSTSPLDNDEEKLIQKTEEELYTRFPYLRERDTGRTHHPDPSLRYTQDQAVDKNQQPYRLYRFIVPPAMLQDRSVAIAGALMCLGSFSCAYIQSLWITSYFDGTLNFASGEQIRAETLRDTQYCAIRGAMGYGRTLPDLVFDSLPYFDVLLGDLGFTGKRKGGLLGLRECVKSYGPEDYRGLLNVVEKRMLGDETKKDI
ncbi:flavin-binding monooxygenase-like protein-like protein [Cucurbitaria berberidis CBS 394.84]|uniref:Flavin-binding monooxygenase-like protein-like protein n=1 Tax=Cucurbitaria berberidis CBS 394.84 TaxID=1168544 RepID=A0A9P4L775_9PLEO|nr:flavin-binding monooxygenase-like protein-like protein [Cucurbitaria berberidis CBS 394.84]KAF1844024.1 flavin-binding monooxygenase-like protein-like protein [Cucurbitaria berberidis CBS 394.84]